MNITDIELETVTGNYSGKEYDLERYNVVGKTPMSTQEFTVTVNHIDKNVTGDCIRYGEWGDLDPEEVKEMLQVIEAAGKLGRPYTDYIIK